MLLFTYILYISINGYIIKLEYYLLVNSSNKLIVIK